jgi:hypothetical protein
MPLSLETLRPESSEYHSGNEISIYQGQLTTQSIVQGIVMIKKAFPALPIDFYDVFMDMVRETNFSDERLRDAIKHVICTCPYPTPTIANFISFDKKIKLNSYEDMIKKVADFGAEIWKSYKAVKFPEREKVVWVHVDDMKIAKLKEFHYNEE